MERESFPVGILIPNSMAKSLAACTALYKRASSPAFLQGHIQLADKETPLIPCSIGAQTKLVKASAIANLEPQARWTWQYLFLLDNREPWHPSHSKVTVKVRRIADGPHDR